MEESISISSPKEFKHLVHLSKDFQWSFDETVDPSSIFRKIREIGKGGFGSVYEIEHIPSHVHLAGKVINADAMTRTTRQALQREVNLLKKISSPFTVQYYGTIIFEEQLMILMEFCDHGSLRDIISSNNIKIDENQISFIISDVLNALVILHTKHNILHRDIKAANILLTKNGSVKLTDFGVSKQFNMGQTMNTVSVTGTPYWMAPESASGRKQSFMADIWSVGITCIELADGAPPYNEFFPLRALSEIATRGFPGFRRGNKYSKDFVDFVSQCCVNDPLQRPSALQLLKHPFITRVSTFDRVLVLKPIMETVTDFDRLTSKQEEEEEEEEEDRPDLQTSFEALLTTSDRAPFSMSEIGRGSSGCADEEDATVERLYSFDVDFADPPPPPRAKGAALVRLQSAVREVVERNSADRKTTVAIGVASAAALLLGLTFIFGKKVFVALCLIAAALYAYKVLA